jgi:NhaC family Na+:H+ antiporter
MTLLRLSVLVFGIFITVILGKLQGYSWAEMQTGLVKNVTTSIPVLGIFLVVDMIIGTWILCGTVTLLTTLGLTILSPSFFTSDMYYMCCGICIYWYLMGNNGAGIIGYR